MLGQNHHFVTYAPETIPYAIERYVNETSRLYQVMENRLSSVEYLAGEYSIADIASYPWIVPHERQKQNLDHFPHLKDWFYRIQEREAVKKAYQIQKTLETGREMTEEDKKLLFGQSKQILKNKDC